MSMKVKPIKIVVTAYGGGVFIGLALSIAGIVLKLHALLKIGLIFFLAGIVIGSIPLIGFCSNYFWKKMQFLFKQKP